MSSPSKPRVLIADEIGHLTAALKAPSESTPATDHQLEFFDSLQLALREVKAAPPAIVMVAQRKSPDNNGLDTAGDIWRAAPGVQVVVLSDPENAIDDDDWQRVFGATNRATLLPWSGRSLEIDQLLHSLIARHSAEQVLRDRAKGDGKTRHLSSIQDGFEDSIDYEQSLMQVIMCHAPDRIFFKDRESRYVRCSISVAEQFGIENATDVVDKSDFDFFSEEHALQTFADDQEVIRSGAPLLAKKEFETLTDGTAR